MSDSPRAARREVGLWALMLGLTLVAIVAAGEVVVRIARPAGVVPDRHYAPGIFSADDELVWALVPGYRGHWHDYEASRPTSTNALGYRGPEETPERLGAALRIAVVGDSVAFGRGVADGDAYPARLEALLAERGLDVAVFNLAVPGYDSLRERIWLERHVARIDPHVVVVGWYRNDVTDMVPPGYEDHGIRILDGQIVTDIDAYQSYRRRISARSVVERSMLLNFVGVRWSLWRKSLRLERRRTYSAENPSGPEAYVGTLAELRRIRALCRERGAAFVLVVHPALDELDGDDPPALAILEAGLADGDGEPPELVSAERAVRGEVPETFYQAGDRSHPNALGHDRIARQLAERPIFARVADAY